MSGEGSEDELDGWDEAVGDLGESSAAEGGSSSVFACPICHKAITQSEARPFCSARCKAVDLGGWLDGSYLGHFVDAEEGDFGDVGGW